MPNKPEAITIRFADDFEENLYALSKKYRSIRLLKIRSHRY
jgi:hypothetical protein